MSFRNRMQNKVLDLGHFKSFTHKTVDLIPLTDETTEKGRTYITPNGIRMPSVTTVLSINSRDKIAQWRKKVGDDEANRISREAADRGTRVHQLCEDYVTNSYLDPINKPIPKNVDDLVSFKSIKKYLDEYVTDVYSVEAGLFSPSLETAGRTDLIANWAGVRSVIDFKTSKKKKMRSWVGNYFQQGAFYCHAWEEQVGTPIEQFVIIIAVDGETEPQVFIEKRDDHLDEFKKTRQRYKEAYRI